MNKQQIIKEAKRVLKVELKSIKTLTSSFNDNFYKIVSDDFTETKKMVLLK